METGVMKTIWMVLLVAGLCSFTRIDTADKANNIFYASINGELYHMRDMPYLEFAEPNSASIGATGASIVKINFPGPSYVSRQGKPFNENLQLMLGYNGQALDTNYFVTMQYQGEYYYVLKDQSKLNIETFEYTQGSNHGVVSGNFECTMRCYNYKLNGKKDIKVSGKMQNLRIGTPNLSAGL